MLPRGAVPAEECTCAASSWNGENWRYKLGDDPGPDCFLLLTDDEHGVGYCPDCGDQLGITDGQPWTRERASLEVAVEELVDLDRLDDWFRSLERYVPGWDDLPELARQAVGELRERRERSR